MKLKNEIKNIINQAKNPLTLDEIVNGIIINRGQSRINSKTIKRIKLILTKQLKRGDGFVMRIDDRRYISRKRVENHQ